MAFIRVTLIRSMRAALRWWRIGVGVTLLIWIVGLIAIHALPDRFEATARLYIDLDAVLLTNLDTLYPGNPAFTRSEILRSALVYKPNLEKLIAGSKLTWATSGTIYREHRIAQIVTGVAVTQQTKNLFIIAFRDQDPVAARDVVRGLLTVFSQSALGSLPQDGENGRRLLERQIQSFEQRLRASDKQRADFRRRYADLSGDSLNPNDLEPDALRFAVTELDARLRAAQALRDATRRDLDETPPGKAPRADGSESPMSHFPSAWRKDRAIEADALVASLTRQRDEARASLERVEKIAREQPELLTEYQNFERDRAALHERYEELVGRLARPGIDDGVDRGADKVKIQVIDSPEVPRVPVAPNRLLLIACVLLSGLAAGFTISGLSGRRPERA